MAFVWLLLKMICPERKCIHFNQSGCTTFFVIPWKWKSRVTVSGRSGSQKYVRTHGKLKRLKALADPGCKAIQ